MIDRKIKNKNIMAKLLKISQMFSTINNNEFSSDKRGFIRSQECNHRSDFVSFADSTDRIFGTVRFPELYVIYKNLCKWSEKNKKYTIPYFVIFFLGLGNAVNKCNVGSNMSRVDTINSDLFRSKFYIYIYIISSFKGKSFLYYSI